MSNSVRKTAVLMLMNIEKDAAYINIEMNKLRSADNFSAQDIRFIGEIVNGVIKRKLTLDYVISLHSGTKIKKIAPFVLAVLRSGAYQILYMDKVPDSAAVNESVKLVKNSSVKRLSGYVNAVLRKVSADDISSLSDGSISDLSVKHSFPVWLLERWVKQFGLDFTISLAQSLNERPSLYIRCNRLKCDTDALKQLLTDEGVEFSQFNADGFSGFDTCFKLDSAKSLLNTQAFGEGFFYVQDPAAALAAYITAPKPGETVIDMCSAPGGKSLFMAELMENLGRIMSFDIHEHKISLIKSNAEKYGADIIEAEISDALVYRPELCESADRVLCDVPCSGLGIIRKKPDIKYARTESDIHELARMSLRIIDNASKYLKKGGILVFSTCTVEPEENERVCEAFLSEHREFSLVPFGDCDCSCNGYKTFYPNVDGTDGFFVAKFQKTE